LPFCDIFSIKDPYFDSGKQSHEARQGVVAYYFMDKLAGKGFYQIVPVKFIFKVKNDLFGLVHG
jgi:hypothetical protein